MPRSCNSLHEILAACCIVMGSFIYCNTGFSQASISGKVLDQEKNPITNVSVLLLHQKDSSLQKGTTSNSTGQFVFEKVPTGNYLLLYSHSGMTDHYSTPFSLVSETLTMGEVQLRPKDKQLTGVTVVAKRPMFEQKLDRLVVNVQNSITNAGSTVLEVLERSPGVFVDRQAGEISLLGKQGIGLMINGKLTYMPPDAVVQMLSGMSASSVDKIELITTPPAKYDAGGSAGFINIVMVANPEEGFNGSYAFSAGYGSGEIYTGSANFNYRKKKINLYGNYSFSYNGQIQKFQSWRSVLYQGKQYENAIDNDRDPFQRNHDPRIGLDYQLSKKTVVGGIIAGYDHLWKMTAINRSMNFINKVPDTSVLMKVHGTNHWQNLMGNLNIQHQLNSSSNISWNADYLWYKNHNPNNFRNSYSKDGKFLFEEEATTSKTTIIKVFVTNVDYTHRINDKSSLEAGAKATFSQFTNDVLVQTRQNGSWMNSPDFTGKYKLHEYVYAAYAAGEFKLSSKTTIKAGLRFEYTNTNLGSERQKNIVDRKYGSLFPTFNISHRLNENNTFNLQYNRRISRPAFDQLAPFITFFDPKTLFSGNAALQPSISDAIRINYTYRKWIFSANYSYASKPITPFLAAIDSTSNRQVTTAQNMNYRHSFYTALAMPIQVAKWWTSQLNTTAEWIHVNFDNNKVNTDIRIFRYQLSVVETFRLPHDFSFEIFGVYNSKTLFGALVRQPYGQLNATIQKKIPGISAALTISAENILNTIYIKASQEIPEQEIYTYMFIQTNYRYFKLAWTQSFGRKSVKASRKRAMASDEEQGRVSN